LRILIYLVESAFVIVIDYDWATGLGLALTGRSACGQIEVRPVEAPRPPVDPPFRAKLLRGARGIALVDVRRIDESSIVVRHWEDAIEGEVEGNILRGVVCNRPIEVEVPDGYEGALRALIPVARVGKPPKRAYRLIAYRLALP
jgi:hypothetical protein